MSETTPEPREQPRRIISASRRTDVPAFYSRWLLRRIEEGYCEWIHPFGGSVQRVSLAPDECLAIVFWTRNPAPLLPALSDLSSAGYVFYFQYTITGYPRTLESHTPPVETAVRTFHELADRSSPDAVIWRYDPIVIGSETPETYHLEQFASLAARLEGATRQAYVSFVDYYGKTRKSLDAVTAEQGIAFVDPVSEQRLELARRLRDIADRRGMTLHACCEDELVGDGIEKGRCVDIDVVRALRPDAADALPRRPTRKTCGCTASVDIGAYDTCPFGCRYCYATRGRPIALERLREHDPLDPLLWRPERLRDASRDG